MSLTPEQLEERRKVLNASDMAAVFGLHPWKTRGDLWAYHVFGATGSQNRYQSIGSYLEGSILDWAEEQLGCPLERGVRATVDGFGASFDGQADDFAVEAKATNGWGPMAQGFGEPGSSDVPDYILIQCQMQCHVGELSRVYVPVFHGKKWRFVMFEVPRDEAMIERLVRGGTDFWDRYVVPQVAPPEDGPSYEVIRKVEPESGSVVSVAPELIRRWEQAKRAEKECRSETESARAALAEAVGTAEFGLYGDKDHCIQFRMEHKKEHVRPASSSRVLRVVNRKPWMREEGSE